MDFIENDYFVLAYQANQLIGFASFADGNYLNLLYAHPEFDRKGVASQLLKAIKAEAKRLGYSTLTTHASKTARPFFERKGFVLIQENRKMMDGVELVNFEMTEI